MVLGAAQISNCSFGCGQDYAWAKCKGSGRQTEDDSHRRWDSKLGGDIGKLLTYEGSRG